LKSHIGTVTRYCRNLRGGSQPILVQASDGFLYVVKFNNNPQGPNLAFNEGSGSELYSAAGLPGSHWKPLIVTNSFLDQHPECWLQTSEGILRPAAGVCFGSRFLGETGAQLLEILPSVGFKRIVNHNNFWLAWMIDICACHSDHRQALFIAAPDHCLSAVFFDHGHIFAGPSGTHRPQFLASQYLDPRIYQTVSSTYLFGCQKVALQIDVEHLWQKMLSLPDEWKTKSALEGFAQCLRRLSDANLLRNIVDTMLEANRNSTQREGSLNPIGKRPPTSILRPRVPSRAIGRRFAAKANPYPACA
jgi:hypothetical protein